MTDTADTLDDHVRPHLDSSALVVIDMQNDFMDEGALPVPGTAALLPNLVYLIDAYRRARRPIVHVVRIYAGDDVDLVRRAAVTRDGAPLARPGTAGSQVVAGLLPADSGPLEPGLLVEGGFQAVGPSETAMWKPRWSAFHRARLDEHLSGLDVDTVVVAGCNFPNCPRATLFDASAHDYRTILASDATSQVTPDHLTDAQSIGVVPMPVAAIAARLGTV
ncbi:cysteine hydrolase family protein [Prescottella defluvii]|uniref:cysteine hydrolase family protein n=1 Tax=Prescottella defluvii TaxID=1323361 RepID=UPI0004F2C2A3|nr:isochorismatase family cysteine hydrolase [Prescottella defluvii]